MKKISYFLSMVVAASMVFACTPKTPSFEFVTSGEKTETELTTGDSLTYTEVNYPQVSNLDQAPVDAGGFITLFDGKTFNGWRGYLKDTVPGKWVIEDGAIKFNGSGAGEAQSGDGGDIIFACKFKNFELSFDWKVDKGANSGVFFLAREVKGEPIYISSPEYQILDNANHPDAQLGIDGNRQSASLYDMKPAVPQNSKPFGEWNTGGILCYKGTVVHKQNGKNVVEYHLWTPQWEQMIAGSKFKKGGGFPLAYTFLTQLGGEEHEGYIGFQDHGDVVWFKNIKLKILD